MSLTVRASVPERGLDIALEVADGQTLALVGPNGAGKSTVLSLIGGLLSPHHGRIELDGRILTETCEGSRRTWVPPHARRVTTLGQDPVLFPHLTGLGNVMFPLRSQGVPARRARAQARDHLAEIGAADLAGRTTAQLSGGQAQRVAIARALAARPTLLMLDEPMAALDIDVAPALRHQLRRFLAERTALIVSHDVLDAMTLADRVAVMADGRLLEHGPTMQVLGRPGSAFTARFAGLNLLEGSWDGRAVVLPAGERLTGRAGHGTTTAPAAEGQAIRAVFRPSATRLLTTDPPPGSTVLRRTVGVLEPLGDLVRVRTEDLAADVTPQDVAAMDLAPGASVDLVVAADDVLLYPAAAGWRHDDP